MADTIRGVEWHLEKTQDTTLHLEGFLSWPWRVGFPGEHDWLIQLLQGVVVRKELQLPLKANFEITQPMWYGLWIRSPLNKSQCSLLHDLLLEMGEQSRETFIAELEQTHLENPDKFATIEVMQYKQIYDEDHRNLLEFLSALKIAITHDIPMHVAPAPSGHADFGILTTWPHCPHCKADSPLDKWNEKEFVCPICGNIYFPTETMSTVEDPIMKELEKLEFEDE